MIKSYTNVSDFSETHKQYLQNLPSDSPPSNTILRDFEMFLDYIQTNHIAVTKTEQLPLKTIKTINERLTQPLEIGLKRPTQKSYPHINGLYLLARASGLIITQGKGKKVYLVVEETMAEGWQALNPVERYCVLFETWLLRGSNEILGGRSFRMDISDVIINWQRYFMHIPDGGVNIRDENIIPYLFLHQTGWHNLGLLELFGLLDIQHGARVDGQPWQIETLRRTPLGDALLTLMVDGFIRTSDVYWELDMSSEPAPSGILQPTLQPYFPAWQNNLPTIEAEFRHGLHTFKVSLGRWHARLTIPATKSLDALAQLILDAVGFDNDHLYQFSYKNRLGMTEQVNHVYLEEAPFTDERLVGQVPLPIGGRMTYLFDFGDNWEFTVILEAVDPDSTVETVAIVETHGIPPEQYPSWEDMD